MSSNLSDENHSKSGYDEENCLNFDLERKVDSNVNSADSIIPAQSSDNPVR